MKRQHTKLIWILALVLFNSCAARYETVRNAAGAQDITTATDQDLIVDQLKPTANVEVILDGRSVTAVPVGSSFVVQPTQDTRDMNVTPRNDCRNVGIQSAVYSLSQKNPVSVQRQSECDPLGTNAQYDTVGQYTIGLEVTDSNGAKGIASMTLTVFNDTDGDGELDEDEQDGDTSSFRISAAPLTAQTNEAITFNGICLNVESKLVSWDFKDGSLGQGETISHSFTQVGSYLVEATCRGDNNVELKASVTVVATNGNVNTDTSTDKDDTDIFTDTDTSVTTDTTTDTDTGTDTSSDTDTNTNTDSGTDTDSEIEDDSPKGGSGPNQNNGNSPTQK